MALDLNEYIRMSYERPNKKVLEGLGASEDLIEYLMETPGNTNWNVIGSIGESGGGDTGEVWLVGSEYYDGEGMRQFLLSNVDTTDHMMELYENSGNYTVYLNGSELTFLSQGESYVAWSDSETFESSTKVVNISFTGEDYSALAAFINVSTPPTSIEVSVKAK